MLGASRGEAPKVEKEAPHGSALKEAFLDLERGKAKKSDALRKKVEEAIKARQELQDANRAVEEAQIEYELAKLRKKTGQRDNALGKEVNKEAFAELSRQYKKAIEFLNDSGEEWLSRERIEAAGIEGLERIELLMKEEVGEEVPRTKRMVEEPLKRESFRFIPDNMRDDLAAVLAFDSRGQKSMGIRTRSEGEEEIRYRITTLEDVNLEKAIDRAAERAKIDAVEAKRKEYAKAIAFIEDPSKQVQYWQMRDFAKAGDESPVFAIIHAVKRSKKQGMVAEKGSWITDRREHWMIPLDDKELQAQLEEIDGMTPEQLGELGLESEYDATEYGGRQRGVGKVMYRVLTPQEFIKEFPY